MGNHDVGRAMAAAAEGFMASLGKKKPTKAAALKFLDAVAKPFRGADAEFDDALHDNTPLRRLVEVAFDATAEEIRSIKGDGEAWFEGPLSRFRGRYDFC